MFKGHHSCKNSSHPSNANEILPNRDSDSNSSKTEPGFLGNLKLWIPQVAINLHVDPGMSLPGLMTGGSRLQIPRHRWTTRNCRTFGRAVFQRPGSSQWVEWDFNWFQPIRPIREIYQHLGTLSQDISRYTITNPSLEGQAAIIKASQALFWTWHKQ